MMDGIYKVFRSPFYIALSVGIALLIFTFAVLLPNFALLWQILPSPSIELRDKVTLVLSLSESIKTNFTVVSATYTILIAILFGVNVSLFAYFVRKQKTIIRGTNSMAGVGGLISGIFGIGCAACGTFILTWILGFIGAAGIISFLPLGGEEFGILGVALLIYAVVTTAKKISEPQVCVTD
ncbi:hypothetical protein JXR01_02430 [Candidatus Kaiserbacteria bacterium]|nr:MAG: hypothetical protein JXR01_02430 [Candidatus Kaiserbacteria bacterium]